MSPTTITSDALHTTELLDIICSYADTPTRVTLLRVSRSYFSSAVSFVWKNLESPFHLLQLIPNTIVKDRAKIILPPYVEADFSRFDIYAPCVRSLRIRAVFQKLKPWDTLLSRSKLGPLLPCLSSLTIQRLTWYYPTDPLTNEFMWMLAFLNQTVTSVYFGRETGMYTPVVSISGFRSLVDMISRTCPNLDSLFLPSVNHNANEEDQSLHIIPNQSIGQHSLPLSGLRKLETGLWIFLEEMIREVGSLAQLNHLLIRNENTDLVLPEHCPVDETAFHALKNLSIARVDWANVRKLLSYQPLVRNLVSFYIRGPLEPATTTWRGTMALFSLKNISKLRNLDIEFDHFNTNDVHRLNPGDFFDVLSQLPLQTIRIAGVQFLGLLPLDLGRVFPAVVEIRLPHQKADLNVFSRFATMPSLKHLTIAFSDWYRPTDWLSQTHSCCPSLETLELTVTVDENKKDNLLDLYTVSYIHTAATRILELFPNIQRIIWPHVDTDSFEHQQLCLLNTRIAVTREWNKARSRIAERYGHDAANALLPDENFLARTLEPFV
ncbi:hypothetical protein FRC12_018621 [Ceratobasidium sp. 428]|nr:hypothetical protein FRC12_018621 [Ceratobasidium sp. 428]